MRYAAAADIGGTTTRAALIREDLTIEKKAEFPTDIFDPYHTLKEIRDVFLSFGKEICGAGISCPGPLDLIAGKVLTPPNLHGAWHDFAIAEEASKLFGVPAYLENDANLAALAEAVRGEGRDHSIVQYMTISTGTGAGLVIDRKIFRGTHGFANEVFNTILENNGPSHGSILPGGLEALCSGTAIETRARAAGLAVRHAGDVNTLALQGDPDAMRIINEAKLYLANYLAGVQAYIDPGIVILGGSVALKIPGFTEEVQELVREKVFDELKPYVNVRKSVLNEDSGLLGAAYLVFSAD